MRDVWFSWFLLTVVLVGINGSVIFPRVCQLRRKRQSSNPQWGDSWRTSERVSCMSKLSGTTSTSMQLAFTPLQAGKFLSLAAVAAYLGKQLRSESVSRALCFWFHAGPVVVHYKFARWYLEWTKAPLVKRDLVHNALHDKYCNPCLALALNLKGLYVKVRAHLAPVSLPIIFSF